MTLAATPQNATPFSVVKYGISSQNAVLCWLLLKSLIPAGELKAIKLWGTGNKVGNAHTFMDRIKVTIKKANFFAKDIFITNAFVKTRRLAELAKANSIKFNSITDEYASLLPFCWALQAQPNLQAH